MVKIVKESVKRGCSMVQKILSHNITLRVVDMGYIGLPMAVTFARAGFKVFGYDVNKTVIEKLK